MTSSRIAKNLQMVENTIATASAEMGADQMASLLKTRDSLRELVAMEARNEADRVARIAATDEAIAEDVPVGSLATVVASKMAKAVVESDKVKTENAKRVAAGRPKMTAEEARRFDVYSEKNAEIAESACENGCEAYEDIFTYRRWLALGFQVQKGAKSTRVEVPIFRTVVDEKTKVEKKIKVGSRMVPVFCRCKVKKIAVKKAA